MGAIWLLNLPTWLEEAGLDVDVWPGWETRSRSSGGYDSILGIGIHHDAWPADASLDRRCRYGWELAEFRPVGAIQLHSDGKVMVGAAGATNTMGRGGPYVMSKGTVPLNDGNRHLVAIEASNNGVGEEWSSVQLDAYVVLCATLCDRLDLDPTIDIISHFEWAPTRKIDPAGPPEPFADPDDRYRRWDMDAFRAAVHAYDPDPDPDPEDDSMLTIRLDGYADQFLCVPIDNPDARRKMGIPDDVPPVVVNGDPAEVEAHLPYDLTPLP